MQRTRTTNREAAQNNRLSHPAQPWRTTTRPPRDCQDSLFAQGRALAQASFSLRSRLRCEDNAPRDRTLKGFSVRQESCEWRTASRSAVRYLLASSHTAALLDGCFEQLPGGQLCISTDSSCIRRDTNDTTTRLEVFHRRMRGFDRVFDVAA